MNIKALVGQVDHRFRQYLREQGHKGTHHREAILQVFLGNSKPVTAKELHYQVKAAQVNVSFHCIYQTMKLLVKSGLAREIIPEDGSARVYTHEIAIAKCDHAHLACKDCGAVIEVLDGMPAASCK
jgi:Fur family ferric uptake transcriptional regulator